MITNKFKYKNELIISFFTCLFQGIGTLLFDHIYLKILSAASVGIFGTIIGIRFGKYFMESKRISFLSIIGEIKNHLGILPYYSFFGILSLYVIWGTYKITSEDYIFQDLGDIASFLFGISLVLMFYLLIIVLGALAFFLHLGDWYEDIKSYYTKNVPFSYFKMFFSIAWVIGTPIFFLSRASFNFNHQDILIFLSFLFFPSFVFIFFGRR